MSRSSLLAKVSSFVVLADTVVLYVELYLLSYKFAIEQKRVTLRVPLSRTRYFLILI
jgi:hypothetical protein